MIARTWGGKVPPKHAEGLHEHLLRTGVEYCRCRRDCVEAKLLRRDARELAHSLVFSIWISMDALRAYAGDAPDKGMRYADDDAFGLVPDLEGKHYDVASAASTSERRFRLAESTETRKTRYPHTCHRLAISVGPLPARTTVAVRELPLGALIEFEAVA